MEDIIEKKLPNPPKIRPNTTSSLFPTYNHAPLSNTNIIAFLEPTQETEAVIRMVVFISSLSEADDLSYYVINLNDFIEGTSEINLVTRRGRYKKALPIEVEGVIFPKKDKVLK